MKILNFGSLNLDHVYHVDHFVTPGETLNASSQNINPGGKGLNQSIALARAGSQVWHAGCAGEGGEMLVNILRENNIDTTYISKVNELQGNAVIQVTPSGENCILLFGGSNQCISSEQIDAVLSEFEAEDCIVLQNEINALGEIVDKAYAKGLKIVLNPSPYDNRLKSVDFGKISWLLINEVEAEQISGCSDPSEVRKYLHSRYPEMSVLMTMGREGSRAYMVNEEGVSEAIQPAYSVKAADTTAAGDTYTGFFITSVLNGLSLQESMKWAAAASAISVTREGAAASIPYAEEVSEFISGEK